jgi:hypothetical protein
MRYLKMLEQKGFDLSELPLATQKKVDELNLLKSDLESLKEIPDDEMEEEDADEISDIEAQIDELDRIIEKKVKQFDPAAHAKKIEQIKVLADLKKQKAKGEEPIKEPREERPSAPTEVEVEEKLSELKQEVHIEAKAEPQQVKAVEQPRPAPQQTPPPPPAPQANTYEEEEYEAEEFDKVGDAKPKKVVSKGMILMGVGFLLLTWGAVNVFKDRRG